MEGQQEVQIYYFSGTGNAAAVTRWFSFVAARKEIPVKLNNLAEIDRKHIPRPEKNSLTGFICPTHGFNFPPVMIHFLFRFPFGNGGRVFFMNTRAGMKAGKFFLPGLSGMALYFSALLLLIKGYRIAGMRSIDLPSNWISIHPGIREKVYRSIIARRRKDTEDFAEKILSGKKVFRGLVSLLPDLAITPVAVLYYFIGRFFLAKTFIASSSCTSCGLCDKSCPLQAIKIIDNRRFWTYRCESCMKCMNHCPEKAIETPHGFVAVLIFILNGFVLVQLNRLISFRDIFDGFLPQRLSSFLNFALENIILVAMIFLSYLILHYLLRFRLFERIVVLTSFTHYSFWRRYKPSWKEFTERK